MLARKMKLILNGVEVETPLLIPSFSSRASNDIDICKTIQVLSEFMNCPVLISAYDICRSKEKFPPITFSELIFIDSGGYECALNSRISGMCYYKPESFNWDRELHSNTIQDWPKETPTVLISYDHPSIREPIEKQVEHANQLFKDMNDILKEILIKPERERSYINLKSLIDNLDLLKSFDIIGFTEKELGKSLLDRMVMIAKIRKQMDKKDIQIPIHVLGSLDPITTPLYYFSGADIFDGLSWLRYLFHDGKTFYSSSFGLDTNIHGINNDIDYIPTLNAINNYNYLLDLALDLEKYQSTGKFDHFENSEFFEDTYEKLKMKIGGS